MGEELVLSLLAIVIHAVSQNGEIYVCLFQKQVVLIVPMSVHEGHHALDEGHLLSLRKLVQEFWSKHMIKEAPHNRDHLLSSDL